MLDSSAAPTNELVSTTQTDEEHRTTTQAGIERAQIRMSVSETLP
jgi:hypothetical protein